jgi:GTP-binding protein YchF
MPKGDPSMKLGIIGLAGAGKTTVFEALTQNIQPPSAKADNRIGTIRVPDPRVDRLSALYKPRKTIYAQVEYYLPASQVRAGEGTDNTAWARARDCDALIHCVRNFASYGLEPPDCGSDFAALDQELIIADLVVVEKRLERLALDRRRGKAGSPEEAPLLEKARNLLEQEIPLRKDEEIATAHCLRGFAFLSAKPVLVLFNNEDDDEALPAPEGALANEESMVIRAKLEQELAQMTAEEAAEFLSEFNITASATDRVIKRSYELLGLTSFFTVGEDEVRAWTIRSTTAAVDAAEVIHSDIKQGFIRAEVLSYEDLVQAGSYAEARKLGTVRLEGKSYIVADGDIINFRFNV